MNSEPVNPYKTLDRICLLTVVVVFLASGYWVVSRGARQLRQVPQENDFLVRSLKDLALAENNLQRLNDAIVETRREIKVLNEHIPNSAKIGEFLRQLDALIKEREITLESFHPLPVVKKKLFTRIPIRLTCRGTFVNIYDLLCDLETMNRLVDVETIAIANPNGDPEDRFDMTASIFERQA